ncbi:MAG: hypothetical protein HY296_03295 [Thaumarchaeota archaeon]|nr:hypothetical protein [Nitrososphaerota archaeon]
MQSRAVVAVVLLTLTLFVSPVAFAAPLSNDRNLSFNSKSLNWSGYAVLASSGSVTRATGSWTQPAVTCSGGSSYAAFWVGIDGANSGTVEQTGTLALCSGGLASYSAWYEFYPAASVTISGFAVNPGDAFSATTSYSGGVFTLTIQDGTTGQSFTKSGTVSGAARSSAECIAERPSIGGSITKLANFGTVSFTGCSATVGGTSAVFNVFSGNTAIDMVGRSGRLLAATSAMTSGAFTVTWKGSN